MTKNVRADQLLYTGSVAHRIELVRRNRSDKRTGQGQLSRVLKAFELWVNTRGQVNCCTTEISRTVCHP